MPSRDRIARTRPPADQGRATALLAAPGRRMKSQSVVDTLGLKSVSGELESGAVLAIEHAFREMAKSLPDDVDSCCRHDLAFHELIIAATGNRLLIGFAGAIRTALLAAFRLSSNARESYENSLSEHWAVAAAIRRRSPDEADQAMRILLAGTARDLAPAYAPQGRSSRRRPSAVVRGR